MSQPNESGVGPKTQEALDALDDAIDKVVAFQDDDDEQDAAPIWERVHKLQEKLAAATTGTSHLPKDALTGLPVDPATNGVDLGPVDPVRTPDPVVTPEEAGQAPSAPEGTPTLTDETVDESTADETSTGRRRGES